MHYEVRYISPRKLSRIMALVLGGLFLIFSLIALPMFLLAPFPENSPGQPPKAFLLVMVVLYPLFGALWGWIGGQVSSRLYNAAAKRLGGVQVELAPLAAEVVAPPNNSLERSRDP